MKQFYDFEARDIDGNLIKMSDYKNKVVLIVNVASKCGLTPQYSGLESLYQRLKSRGFEIIGFPCNQFAGQEPGTEQEIKSFCSLNYPVSFKLFSKIDVNGPEALPLYKFLQHVKTDTHKNPTAKEVSTEEPEPIKWNFAKFIVDRKGQVLTRFSPQTTPEDMGSYLESLL
jgi:glutathione peroxidase